MAISDPPFTMADDGGADDLPRTVRREKEAREREARERQALERQARERIILEPPVPPPQPFGFEPQTSGAAFPSGATVSRFDVPFFHLMRFFLKAVFAGVPALVVLGVMIWIAGHVVQTYFPHLVKMQILILFPPN